MGESAFHRGTSRPSSGHLTTLFNAQSVHSLSAPFISSCPQESSIQQFEPFPDLNIERAVNIVLGGGSRGGRGGGLVGNLLDSALPSGRNDHGGLTVEANLVVESDHSWHGGNLMGALVGVNSQGSVPAVSSGSGTWTLEVPEGGGRGNYLFLCYGQGFRDSNILAGPALIRCKNKQFKA